MVTNCFDLKIKIQRLAFLFRYFQPLIPLILEFSRLQGSWVTDGWCGTKEVIENAEEVIVNDDEFAETYVLCLLYPKKVTKPGCKSWNSRYYSENL